MKDRDLEKEVIEWGTERDIFEQSDALAQGKVVREEALELVDELIEEVIINDNRLAARKELGDVIFSAIMCAKTLDTTIGECLELAIEKNKNRKGKMVNGKWTKEEDL